MTDPFAALTAAAAAAAAEGAALQAQTAALTAQVAADQAMIAQLEAELEKRPPAPGTGTAFGIDLSDLTGDEPLTEAAKVDAHRALGLRLTGVRVFFGAGRINWRSERIAALDPTKGDSIVISTLSTDIAGLTVDLKNTPDAWRGHVDVCHGHERDADLLGQANPDAAIADWLSWCGRKLDMLDGLGSYGYSTDNFGKITLAYTQNFGALAQRNTRERFYGGQDAGWWGEDCYHNARWLNQGRYSTNAELFDPVIAFASSVGLPLRIPEWGATLAKGDSGAGRAKVIADGGAYLQSEGVVAANWWCGTGSKDATQPEGYRNFHLEGGPSLAAYLALMA